MRDLPPNDRNCATPDDNGVEVLQPPEDLLLPLCAKRTGADQAGGGGKRGNPGDRQPRPGEILLQDLPKPQLSHPQSEQPDFVLWPQVGVR